MNCPSKKNLQGRNKSREESKGMKRSKSTELLMPKQSAPKQIAQKNCNLSRHCRSLVKSNTANSIKSKPKTLLKKHKAAAQQRPKPRPKENSMSSSTNKRKLKNKTPEGLKKRVQKQSKEGKSIVIDYLQEKDSKLNHFFYYRNHQIPIENSAQRRLVYRLEMIDGERKVDFDHKSTTDSLFQKDSTNIQPQMTQDRGVGPQFTFTVERAVETKTQFKNAGVQIQKRKHFEQSAEKCFADALAELEFLYLPNEENFEPFSKQERQHFGEMLESVARRLLSGGGRVVVDSILSEDQISVLLYQRQGIMIGALDYIPSDGFPTHLMAIMAYLKNLLCFIDGSFKDELINGLRSFYGLNYNLRVSRVTRRMRHQKEMKGVLSNQIFEAFDYQMFKDYEFGSQLVKQAVHIHNRAIFDAVNAELQTFRPFYSSEGQPFPWTINLGMTHYDITDEALYIIFMQVKDKIQKIVVTLCGMNMDFQDTTLPLPHDSLFYQQKMKERADKMILEEINAVNDEVLIDYQRTTLMFDLGDAIIMELMSQEAKCLSGLKSIQIC